MIELRGISKSYKVAQRRSSSIGSALKSLVRREYTSIQALSDISFRISPGEIVGYIGPNGAGKSTTIKIMSGILVPDSGSCSILGFTPWQDRKAYVRHIGVVFGQRTQLWWDVPVIDSFDLLRDIYRVPAKMYRDNLELLVDKLALGDLIHTPVRQLSLGQRMRCEIAASLLHSPDILFLDEPTIGLDAVSKVAVRDFIRMINRERGVTVILTTHDMSDIEALADRIIMIGKGRLLLEGKLAELRSRFGSHKTIVLDYRPAADPSHSASPSSQASSSRLTHASPFQLDHLALPHTEVVEWSQERAVLRVDTNRVKIADVISLVSTQVELLDITVESQPIEEIIVDLYKEYQLS
ncbi:hypothetical protein PRECH8_16670 [Insulibacter thermoxylanivorax]|uniref:ABC transporter domain-containing protein n=1 Tax=Insulibacter thermoxylanivorax TaxID=2749268 RepID=A0A916QH38_9BACL|nr:ATP-binding cassette domain-containing protein [Insulibacter thermoxylanivorax]GFR38371.1 hypothetical protein PRECH8_16670 [Insulibacter thermoxylanivorax]